MSQVAVSSSSLPGGAAQGLVLRRVLVIDGEEERRQEIQVELARRGIEAVSVDRPGRAVAELERGGYDAVFCHFSLAGELADAGVLGPVVITAGPGDVDRALADARFHARRRPPAPSPRAAAGALIGDSPPMVELSRLIDRAAAHKATVLILGESGTGKELVARALHERGPRAAGPFVAVNCGAIPATLLESELFGHVKGAFTGAVRDRPGLFEQAHGGTLLLDEIGELLPALQVKLLRVLQEEEVRRVGGTQSTSVDVRVVAATVRDLAAEVAAGRFRQDLFYRLNVLPIELPPLRERGADVELLAQHFARHFADKHGTRAGELSADALALLRSYPWPGNVRELENTIERATVLSGGERIDAEILAQKLSASADRVRDVLGSGELSIKKTARIVEQELIRRALATTSGNRTNAAKLLEISHRALLYKIKEYGL